MLLPFLFASILACHSHRPPVDAERAEPSEITAIGRIYFGDSFVDEMRGNVSKLIDFLGIASWSPNERCLCRRWSLRRYPIADHIGPSDFGVLVITTIENPDRPVLALNEALQIVAHNPDLVSNTSQSQLMLAQDALLDCANTPTKTWIDYDWLPPDNW